MTVATNPSMYRWRISLGKIFLWLFILAAILVATLIGIGSDLPPSIQSAAVNFSPLIKGPMDKAAARNAAAFEKFKNETARISNLYQPRYLAVADQAARKASELSSCSKIVYFLALDSARDTAETDDFIKREINPIVLPVTTGLTNDLSKAIGDFRSELQLSQATLENELSALRASPEPSAPQVNSASFELNSLGEASKQIGSNFPLIALFSIEDLQSAYRSRISQAIISKVKSLALKMFGKQVAKASASATLAVADGPLIFGDILAVLGLAWTGYDLVSLQDEFRTAVDASINESLQASASEITGKVTSAGLFLSSTYEARRIETGSSALKRLMTPS